MDKPFQFNLRALLVATGLSAATMAIFLAATRAEPPLSIAIFIAACATLGAAVGSLFRLTVEGAFWGLLGGAALAVQALSIPGF